ncbi:MAG: peroxide stress protein YaaA [Solirubrobacterales bacterium]
MLVLLPPSEGKADAPEGAAPVDLAALAHPELTPQREKLTEKLDGLTKIAPARALKALGLGKSQAGEIARNAKLLRQPAAPAADIYTGVLYQYLDLHSLKKAERARAAERILIQSALWGVVRLEDRIPAYRLGIGASLPRMKGLAAYWKPALERVLPSDGLVVDMRSSGYVAAWKPAGGTLLGVRVFVEEEGKRSVVTHMAKATRGDVARILVESKQVSDDPHGVEKILAAAGLRTELVEPEKAGGPWNLDVILSERVGRLTKG